MPTEIAPLSPAWAADTGRILTPDGVASHYPPVPHAPTGLRVLSLTRYDPGSAAYRYHSAANSVTGGTSAFVRYGHDNPHCDLRQWDGETDEATVHELFHSADVIHVHMDYNTLEFGVKRWPERRRQLLVRHYHGSQPADEAVQTLVQHTLDDDLGAMHIGARLYHHRFSKRMHWLPIPVPVADYERLTLECWKPRAMRHNRCLRIAHSPTHARIKGTIVLETVVQDLQLKGYDIELVMIADKPHGEALRLKASCDVTFDSFWLGIQGSGLEAAAMGQVVIAGDPLVKAEYERELGECPYTYVGGSDDLRAVLERLYVDVDFRQAEAERVGAYTRAYHDYPVVGARYWALLTAEYARRFGTG